MNQPVPGGALPLGLTLAPFAVPGERDAALAVVTALREPLEPSSRSLELAVMALDARCGDCRDLPSERGRFTISASEPESWQAEVLSRMTLPPGRYEIRVAAGLDGRSGGVFAHVEVPDYRKDRISASGLVLSGGGGAATARADLMADLIPVVPTARREFRADAEVTAFLRIYQGGSRSPGSVRLTATILDAAGRTKLDRTSFLEGARFAGDRAEDYRLELPLASLESGGHLLTIEAHLGGDAIRRDARFDVR
jgi:hypothetical protein